MNRSQIRLLVGKWPANDVVTLKVSRVSIGLVSEIPGMLKAPGPRSLLAEAADRTKLEGTTADAFSSENLRPNSGACFFSTDDDLSTFGTNSRSFPA
jgi:hypothetical protein